MHEPIDELVQRWRQNPSPVATIALCEALRSTPRVPLVQQVGEFAMQRHGADVGVLVSVARMYIESHRFGDAQTVLVGAGKQAPRDGNIYRFLGEVLLRRGDADRAEKVLEQSIQLGTRDPDAQLWLERARVFRPMQAKAGTRAVAAEVAHATAHPAQPMFDSAPDSETAVRVRPAPDVDPGAAVEVDEEKTYAEPRPAVPAAGAPAPRAFPSSMPPLPPSSPAPAPVRYAKEAATAPHGFEPSAPSMPMRAPDPSSSSEIETAFLQPVPTGPSVPKHAGLSFESGRKNGTSPAGSPYAASPASRKPAETPMVPHPRDVLDALALSGVFEPPTERSTAAAGWAAADRGPKRKGAPTLIVGMVLFLAGSVGTYMFYRHKRAEEHVQAEVVLDAVEGQLEAGRPDTLSDAEKQLSQAFQLESRSPRAALDWAHERAAVGLEKSGADVAFEDAMTRAKELGVPEEKYAFARIASFLFQGDTAGAAAVLPRWDGPSGSNPWYQMVAGATLERAGDARARDRYATAAKLDPKLVIAQVAQARATAVDGDAGEAMRLSQALRKSMPDRAEPIALVALAWGRIPTARRSPFRPKWTSWPSTSMTCRRD